jgi:hypothetical protein
LRAAYYAMVTEPSAQNDSAPKPCNCNRYFLKFIQSNDIF